MRSRLEHALPFAALILLSACSGGDYGIESTPAAPARQGPAADYPIVIGQPFTVDGVTYTPADTMNYDALGYAGIGPQGANTVSAAHRTLPLPCYVEVTALDSGKTILVRIERRGPMTGSNLIQLSPGAAAQLGLAGQYKVAVRVRRVNPVEPERALLRSGQQAPARIDTPKSLLGVLQRKLDKQEGITAPTPVVDSDAPLAAAPPPRPVPAALAPRTVPPAAAPAPAPAPAPAMARAQPAPRAARGNFIVQVGAFSDPSNARSAASRTGGSASQAGTIWRVRMGPFQTEDQARAALAKARSAGYGDAQIFHAG